MLADEGPEGHAEEGAATVSPVNMMAMAEALRSAATRLLPSYLARFGEPKTIEDLAGHHRLGLAVSQDRVAKRVAC